MLYPTLKASVSLTVRTIACSFTAVTIPASTGSVQPITEGQALTYSLLSPLTSYAVSFVTTPNCGFTYVVNMEMHNG
jgi:hypothetical protein